MEVQNFNASFFGGDRSATKRTQGDGADIKELHHIAIIVSSEKSIGFYGKLGFREIDRMDRGYEIIVMMEGPCLLEFYIDPTHRQGSTGLRQWVCGTWPFRLTIWNRRLRSWTALRSNRSGKSAESASHSSRIRMGFRSSCMSNAE